MFLAAMLVPVARRWQNPPGMGIALLQRVALRFRPVAWVLIALLIGTGLGMADRRGIGLDDFFTSSGWFINVLRIKVALILLMLVLGILHDFLLGPRVARRLGQPGQSEAPGPALRRSRRWLAWLARLNVLVVLAVVVLGVILTKGLPY